MDSMKHTITVFLSVSIAATLLTSCSTSDEFLKALKIPTKENKSAATPSKAELEMQLAAAKKNEAALKNQVAALQNQINEKDASLSTQVAVLTEEIEVLRKEIDEQEELISIQSRVIGLLDDADRTLQKSIEDQLRDR